ncbi:phage exclusion protein Lit family protein [Brevibacillus brevis]|uniref:phage exclusion protein Lit family protein n=1 Tax=Brevibacillus brevis TaxID=1393 RepID=UPI001C8E6CE8|nr:phage exclusion protein Lit family protein [Brevibacillus brevis]MBY0088417.1 hypothetical protein [Brevibacillus brevis]
MSEINRADSLQKLINEMKQIENRAYNLVQKHPDYEEILTKRAEEAGIDYFFLQDIETVESNILRQLLDDIISVYPSYVAEKLRSEIGIGLINSGHFRARLHKEKEKAAILINYGLLTFLNQCTKYSIACKEPQYIVFCDRKSPDSVTQSDIETYFKELCSNYQQRQLPVGPLILLDEKTDPLRVDLLYIKELFIVSHEMGHHMLGHQESSYRNELEADCYAYTLVLGVIKQKRAWLNEKFLFTTLIELFKDMQYYQGLKQSDTHPQPYWRLIAITRSFFGDELTFALRESLFKGDNKALDEALSKMPNFTNDRLLETHI